MYQNPYAYANPYPTFNNHQQQIIRVHGRNGADTYQMMPNSSVLLLDETAPLVYLAQTDGAGYKTVTVYDIQAHKETPMPNMQDLEHRISRLEEMITNESNNSSTKQWKSEQAKPSSTNGANNQVSKQSSSIT